MSQDVDLQSTRAEALAEELRLHLSNRFHVAVRLRSVSEGQGFRLYQVQATGNRHLVGIRAVTALPPARELAGIAVAAPEELIAQKTIACHRRRNQPKSGTDWRDLTMLLLAFPDLKRTDSIVTERLKDLDVESAILDLWQQVVETEIIAPDEDEEFW